MRQDGKNTKRRATKLAVRELSGVTVPAHDGALVTLFKLNPHQEDKKMSEDLNQLQAKLSATEAALATMKQANAALQSQLEAQTAIAGLTDAEKEVMAALPAGEQASFASKSSAERQLVVKARQEANPVVYKAASGVEYRKSDDQRLVDMARKVDESDEKLRKAAEAAQKARLESVAATELKHLPGELSVKVSMLGLVESLQDADKAAVMAMLKAGNSAISGAFKTIGSSVSLEDNSEPLTELKKMAEKHAAERKISYESAYAEVLATEAGSRLYTASMN